MANMFKSVLVSGNGDGADLIVTCSQNFAGSVITCTDGSSYTKTQTCPSSSPYEVTFESIPIGTYTISGVVSGQTYSITKTILDFDASLTDIPDGSTVTPTDDVQVLLNCANIWDKSYTTISDLLADTTSLLAVISDNNAVDYLVRSTTFATSVCANSIAMTYIGADNYCADTLLSDSTWCNAICDSTYFESVLNDKIPTMTSNTTPSGTVTASTTDSRCTGAWAAFKDDFNSSNSYTEHWMATTSNQSWLGYQFTTAKKIIKIRLRGAVISGNYMTMNTYSVEAYNGTDWITILPQKTAASNDFGIKSYNVNCQDAYSSYRLKVTSNTSGYYVAVANFQMYSRKDV